MSLGSTVSTSYQLVHPRYPLSAEVEVYDARCKTVGQARFRNVSLSGCFIETDFSLPKNTRIRLLMRMPQLRADVWGVVKRCDPGVGIGVQFTNGNTVEDWKHLEKLIAKLEASRGQTRV